MHIKEKHIELFNLNLILLEKLKGLNKMYFTLVFLFIFAISFASDQTGVIYKASDDNRIIITEGKITATEGNSIRLLPGTHIKTGEQLIVDISNKAHQQALAEKFAKEQEKKMLANVAKQRIYLQLPKDNEEFPLNISQGNAPVNREKLIQQLFNLSASLTNVNHTFNIPISTLHKNNNHFNNNYLVLNMQSQYTPISSWGNCAETIKVMRC